MRAFASLLVFLSLAVPAFAQTTPPAPIPGTIVSAAHKIFLTDNNPGHEDASSRIFRDTLKSTGRFELLPSTRGADLILIFGRVIGRTVPPVQAPLLLLEARDPHTFASLGRLQVPWAVLPSLEKDQQAVTLLLNALFALDTSRPAPTFTVTSTPVNGLTEALTTPLTILKSLIPVPMSGAAAQQLARAHSVFLVADSFADVLPPEYTAAVAVFTAGIARSGRLQTTTSFDQADILIQLAAVRLYSGGEDDNDETYTNYLSANVVSAATLTPIFGEFVKAPSGKKKKPAPVQAAANQLADKVTRKVAGADKKMAKHP